MNFYSHAREGRDAKATWAGAFDFISTHTPARGVTGLTFDRTFRMSDFYSHAREGRDGDHCLLAPNYIISTHTPARGVT